MRIALIIPAAITLISLGCASKPGGCPFGFDRLGGERPVAASQPATKPVTQAASAGKQPGPQLSEMVLNFARRGQADAIREYLAAGYSPSFANSRGDTPLILAAYHGNTEVVSTLLAAPGIDVNATNAMGFTALTGAAFKGSTDIARQLLHAGADVNAAGPSGKTPLMFAALAGKEEVVDLLLASGADADRKATDGSTAASLAAGQGNEALARRLHDSK